MVGRPVEPTPGRVLRRPVAAWTHVPALTEGALRRYTWWPLRKVSIVQDHLETSGAAFSARGEVLNGVSPGAAALKVLGALEDAGFEAWIVGGWVRDALMGRSGHDIDICCSAVWREAEDVLRRAGIKVVESGARFGGITAVVEGERFEVTEYRMDGFYTDGRHPDSVEHAASVEEDLARRDFTVNAMAWHPVRGLLDPYDGRGDLARHVIRAVGDPCARFEEDALRILRAVRFACRLGFDMEEGTAAALSECAPLLSKVSQQRIGAELDGILLSGGGGKAMLRYPDVFCAAVPELAAGRGFDQCSRYHIYDVYDHTAHVVDEAAKLPDHGFPLVGAEEGASAVSGGVSHEEIPSGEPAPLSRSLMWAAFLHDIAKPDCFTLDECGQGHFYGHPKLGARMARTIMRRLALPGDLVRDACLLVRYHDKPIKPTRSDLLGIMRTFSGQGVDVPRLTDELFDLKRADALSKAPACFGYVDDIEQMRGMVHGFVEEGDPYCLKMLDLTGDDLLAAGIEPGPQVGELLDQALSACIAGEVGNERSTLLAYLGLTGA